jgi:hypothetical protein
MALISADRVRGTVNAPGTTANITVTSVTGYDNFSSVLATGDTCYYTIADQTGANWEVGLATATGVTNQITRTTVFDNSAGTTALINFSSGVQDVFLTYPAARAVHQARQLVYQSVFNL